MSSFMAVSVDKTKVYFNITHPCMLVGTDNIGNVKKGNVHLQRLVNGNWQSSEEELK